MSRRVHLDAHVGRVLSSTLDLYGVAGCHILAMDDLELSVLRQMAFPYVRYSTRLVEDHGTWQESVDFPDWYIDVLDCLEVKLTGGADMSCELNQALLALAQAVKNSGANNCTCSGASGVANSFSNLDNDEIVPPAAPAVDPFGIEPPEGFDSMDDYRAYKCKAAHAIVDAVKNVATSLQGMGLTQIVGPVVAAWAVGLLSALGVLAVTIPPASVAVIIAAVIASAVLGVSVFIVGHTIADHIETHRAEIVCALYQSGNAAAALQAIGDAIEDAIQAVEWSTVFGGLAAEAEGVWSALFAQVQSNGLVNSLFQLVADFAYPDQDCSECVSGECTNCYAVMENDPRFSANGTEYVLVQADPVFTVTTDQPYTPGHYRFGVHFNEGVVEHCARRLVSIELLAGAWDGRDEFGTGYLSLYDEVDAVIAWPCWTQDPGRLRSQDIACANSFLTGNRVCVSAITLGYAHEQCSLRFTFEA